ncbi:hypothetical protein ACVWWG_000012 [Bradyrhizobium sp. LB7.2]
MPARVQGVEVGHSVDAQHQGLTVDAELLLAVLQRGLDNPGEAIRLVVAVPVSSRASRPLRSTRKR